MPRTSREPSAVVYCTIPAAIGEFQCLQIRLHDRPKPNSALIVRVPAQILKARKLAPETHERWVFNSNRKGWKTGEKGHLASPRNAFKRIVEKAGLTDLRIHDLRRTAGSYMAIEGISPTIIGKALGHRSPQATAVYARLTQDPVRQALERAQQALTKPTNSDTGPESQNAEQTDDVALPQPAPAKRQKKHLRIVG